MTKRLKTETLELMKVMSDPRRSRILHLADDGPVTVKQLAEQLGEQPSRLYYHVKKLLEADLLEVVETRQHGNLVEKYYQAVNYSDVIYRGDMALKAEHPQLALAAVHRKIDPALRMFEKGLQRVREEKEQGDPEFDRFRLPYHVAISNSSSRMTGEEWWLSLQQTLKAMGKRKDDEPWPEFPITTTPEEEEREGTYQYVLISYRIEDAEQLGVIDKDPEEEEAKND